MNILYDLMFPSGIISVACQGKRRRRTDLATDQAGFEQTNIVWQRSLREYEIGLCARPVPQFEAIINVHEIAGGRANAFPFRDPVDSRVAAGEGFLRPVTVAHLPVGTSGFGFGVPTYRMLKRYTSGSRSKDSDVSLPETGTVVLTRGGAPVTIGASAGNAAIDYQTGFVTFVADATGTVVDVTVGATTVVELNASIGLSVGQRLWLQGLGGADAALLNNSSHEITAVAGAEYTLSTATTGATISATGTGLKYPQSSEALRWTGSFFIPVRFDDDDLDWQIASGSPDEDVRLVMTPSIRLVEIRVP
jgi:uncharacterized protein (TIGR02217 family)